MALIKRDMFIEAEESDIIDGKLVIPPGIAVIYSVFKDKSKRHLVREVEISEGVQTIVDYAFEGMKNLTKVKLPQTLERIGKYAFSGTGIDILTLPDGLICIEEGAFSNCDRLKRANIPPKLEVLPQEVFACSGLEDISTSADSSLKYIARYAFWGCDRLNPNIDFSKDVTIDRRAFELCSEELCRKFKDYVSYEGTQSNYKNLNDTVQEVVTKYRSGHLTDEELIARFRDYFGCNSENKRLSQKAEKITTTLDYFLLKESLIWYYIMSEVSERPPFQEDVVDFLDSTISLDDLRRETDKNEMHEFLIDIMTSYEQMEKPKEPLRISFARALQVLELRFPSVFIHTNVFFEEIAELKARDYVKPDQSGKTELSWLDAIYLSYNRQKEINRVRANIPVDVFNTLHNVGMAEDEILNIFNLINKARESGVKTSLIGGLPTSFEGDLAEKVAKVREQMVQIQEGLKEAYAREFSYEWLAKDDVNNAVLGLYCNCCANLAKWNTTYGKKLAEHTMYENDLQNLVVRDKSGSIIAKGTLYINYIEEQKFRLWCN